MLLMMVVVVVVLALALCDLRSKLLERVDEALLLHRDPVPRWVGFNWFGGCRGMGHLEIVGWDCA